MHWTSSSVPVVAALLSAVLGCDSCYGPQTDVVLTRNRRRMQPESQDAVTQPRGPLEWGQINFLHTTDTHGWLEGHLKERNYGADWGDFVSFSRRMRHKAGNLGVDLLLVDTGDLHDGAGLSDSTKPNGNVTNVLFENIDYDLLAIGNHELYVSEVAYEHFYQFSKAYGDKYVTSNVEIINPATGRFEYVGSKYRYFTTPHGLRIMVFGVLFDFKGNSNVSRITTTANLVKQQWFLDAVDYKEPIDLFVVIGHNPPRPTSSTSTFGTLFKTIRGLRPDVPIQVFGGHTHVRDFVVYDEMATGLISGRYCETLGWLSISGIKSSTFKDNEKPRGVPNPTQPAIVVSKNTTSPAPTPTGTSGLVYSRRYLDWNRLTFAYHTGDNDKFDYHSGLRVTNEITDARKKLGLSKLYGCAPDTYCQYCQPFGSVGNIYTLVRTALGKVVVNEARKDTPRLIIVNSGHIRFDLAKGPFAYDDSFIVSPFLDTFQYIPDVPYQLAKQVLGILNSGPFQKRDLIARDFDFSALILQDSCIDPPITHDHATGKRYVGGTLTRRESTQLFPGWVTTDDFGSDGDDTPHTKIPYFNQPNDVQANASFPADGSEPATVDLVFLDFITSYILNALKGTGGTYTVDDVKYYMPKEYTTNSYLPAYAKLAWQENLDNCPVGIGIGSTK